MMWRNIARFSKAAARTHKTRRCFSTVIPGPCIVHKRGADILHDPWFNKLHVMHLVRVTSEHSLVMAVVGRGHLQGIKKNWKQPIKVHLIEGILDQVDGTIHVSWAQPRVLGIPQMKSLRDQVGIWVDKVHTTFLSIESETPDLVAA